MEHKTDTSPAPSLVMITTTFPGRPGDGTPEFVLTLARAIEHLDVTVVAPRVRGGAKRDEIDGVHVRRVAYFPQRWEGLAEEAIMPTLQREPWRVVEVPFLVLALLVGAVRAARARRGAVVLNPHWIVPAGLIAWLLSFVLRVPYVLTVHGADAYTLSGRLPSMLKRAVIRRAAAVFPVSDDIARTVAGDGIARSVEVLRMGVDARAIEASVAPRAPKPGAVLFIGRLASKKGVRVLLDAVATVDSATLRVIGDGPDREMLEAHASALGIGARVQFEGKLPKEQVLAAVREATVVALPSVVAADGDQEGTPVVLAEAMAAGVPVVASALGGLAECIVDGESGLLVPPGDAGALADALRRVLDGEIDIDAMSAAARERARTHLDIGAVARRYEAAVRAAAAGDT